MKFGASLYSFYGSLTKGLIKEEELIGTLKELGFDAAEVVDFVNLNCESDKIMEKCASLKAEAQKHGIMLSALAIGSDFICGSDGSTDEEIKRVKHMVDCAEALGVNKMRMDMTRGYPIDSSEFKSFDALLPTLANAAREIAEYAKDKGILIMTENHGFFSQDSRRVEKLYDAVNHPNFALLCDIGNFLCADEDPALAVTRVAPYSRYVHVKDFIVKPYSCDDPGEGSFRSRGGNFLRGTVLGHGNVPVKHCLRQLMACGYDDVISIEFEGLEESVEALRIGLANIKRFVAEIENERRLLG